MPRINVFGAELTPVTTIAQLERVLGRYARVSQSVVVFGQPGVGKSAAVQSLALTTGRKLFQIHGPHHGPEDFKFPVVHNPLMERLVKLFEYRFSRRSRDTSANMPDFSTMPEAMQSIAAVRWLQTVFPSDPFWDGFIFIDEFGYMPTAVQAALLGLFHSGERRIGTDYVLPAKATVIGASNLLSDGSGSTRSIAPMVLRINKLLFQPDVSRSLSGRTFNDEFCQWLDQQNYAAADDVISFVRCYPDKLHDYSPDRLADSPTPRGWAEVAQLIDKQITPDDHLLVAGKIGPSIADQFCAHRELTVRIDPIAVVNHPDTSAVPENEPALLWATVGAVAGVAKQATPKQQAGIVRYLCRCPAEYAVYGIIDAMSRCRHILESTDGGAFLRKFGPLIAGKQS